MAEEGKRTGAGGHAGAPKAFIMGRNLFGPGRGEWDLEWRLLAEVGDLALEPLRVWATESVTHRSYRSYRVLLAAACGPQANVTPATAARPASPVTVPIRAAPG
jgi:hypothetical protein